MRLRLTTGSDIVEVDFIPEATVPTPDCYLLVYEHNSFRYIIKDGTEPDIRTDDYAEFHVTALHHVSHGHFHFNKKKVCVQVGFYMSRLGAGRFVPALLHYDFGTEQGFRDANSDIFIDGGVPTHRIMVIDLGDFNRTREALGLEGYTLKQLISKRLANPIADEWGLTLSDDTSLFSVVPDKFDAENIMTVKGMRIFIEEQDRKKSTSA